MKQTRWIFIFLPLLLASCASSSGPSPQDAQAQQASGSFQPTFGTAGLYIYKTGVLVTAADSFQVNLDGQMVGLVAWNSYLYEALTPGQHTLASGTSQVTLNVQSGQNYFVRQTPNIDPSGRIVSSTLSVTPPAAGLQQIKQMQLAGFSH